MLEIDERGFCVISIWNNDGKDSGDQKCEVKDMLLYMQNRCNFVCEYANAESERERREMNEFWCELNECICELLKCGIVINLDDLNTVVG